MTISFTISLFLLKLLGIPLLILAVWAGFLFDRHDSDLTENSFKVTLALLGCWVLGFLIRGLWL